MREITLRLPDEEAAALERDGYWQKYIVYDRPVNRCPHGYPQTVRCRRCEE